MGGDEPSYTSLLSSRLVFMPSNGLDDLDRVLMAVEANGLDQHNLSDVAFGVIISRLVESGLVLPNAMVRGAPAGGASAAGHGDPIANPSDADVMAHLRRLGAATAETEITRPNYARFRGLAKTISIAALHAYAEGKKDGDVEWFDSYVAVKGKFISQSRFTALIAVINNSAAIGSIADATTLQMVKTESKVLQYRLTKLSSPGLVGKALSLLPYEGVLKNFNAVEVAAYRAFSDGGITAHIASGPLSEFCRGTVPADRTAPNTTTIGQLRAMDAAPFFPSTLRKTYAVLEACGCLPTRWYQGEAANASKGIDDLRFRAYLALFMTDLRAEIAVITQDDKRAYHDIPAVRLQEIGNMQGW